MENSCDISFHRKKEISAKVIGEKYLCSVIFEDEHHSFEVSVTVNSNMEICDSSLVISRAPYDKCKGMYELVEKVRGLTVEKGFSKKIGEITGGRDGCTHLIDIFTEIGRGLVQLRLKHLFVSGNNDEFQRLLRASCMAY